MNLIISDLVMQRGCLQYLEGDASLYVDIGGSVRASADIICAMLKHDSYRSAFAADGNDFSLHRYPAACKNALSFDSQGVVLILRCLLP